MQEQDRYQAFSCSRRDFWPALFQEILAVRDAFRGKEACRLSELGDLPDHQIATVRPMVNPDYEIFVDHDHVCCRVKGTDESRRLFVMKKENLIAFNQFSGRYSLREIGLCLAREMGWEEDEGFSFVKTMFLALMERMICVPRDPLVFCANTDSL